MDIFTTKPQSYKEFTHIISGWEGNYSYAVTSREKSIKSESFRSVVLANQAVRKRIDLVTKVLNQKHSVTSQLEF